MSQISLPAQYTIFSLPEKKKSRKIHCHNPKKCWPLKCKENFNVKLSSRKPIPQSVTSSGIISFYQASIQQYLKNYRVWRENNSSFHGFPFYFLSRSLVYGWGWTWELKDILFSGSPCSSIWISLSDSSSKGPLGF